MDHEFTKFTLVFPKRINGALASNEVINSISDLLYSKISIKPKKRHFIVNKIHSANTEIEWSKIIDKTNELLEINKIIDDRSSSQLLLRESKVPDSIAAINWQETFNSFLENTAINNVILNLLDEDHIYWFDNYVANIISECTHIEINYHSDCNQLFQYVDTIGSFGHLIINDCLDESYIEALRRTQYFESICLIKEKNSQQICHFDFKRNLLEISKFKSYPSLNYWSKIHFSTSRYFISYSSKDDYQYLIGDIRKCIKRYFPFINIETDKDIDKHFKNINTYVSELIEGDDNLVFYLIGKNYLKSFYSAYELLMTFKKFDLLGKTEDELKTSYLIDNLMTSGRFLLIESGSVANKIRNTSNAELEKYWKKEHKQDTDKRDYTDEQIKEVIDNIDNIKKVISCINTPMYIHHYYSERYKSLVLPVSNALGKINEFSNLYKTFTSSDIESLSGLEGYEVNPYVLRSLSSRR